MRVLERLWTMARRSAQLACGAAGLALGLTGCGSVEPVPPQDQPITSPTQLYMRLTIDHPGVTISTVAPYDTAQLVATPRDALGNAMTDLPAPIFKVLGDTTRVHVTANGLVTALNTTSEVAVLASLMVGPVTHTDTAWVKVTNVAAPLQLDTLSIHPLPPDSAVWSIPLPNSLTYVWLAYVLGAYPTLSQVTPRAVSTTGSAMSGLEIVYTSLDPAVATFQNRRSGVVSLMGRPGMARLIAQATAYGVTRVDTVAFTVTMPAAQSFQIRSGPNGIPSFLGLTLSGYLPDGGVTTSEVRIAPYGIVGWFNATVDSVEIVFDDPTDVTQPPAFLCDALGPDVIGIDGPYCGVGNVSVAPGDGDFSSDAFYLSERFRQFPVPGVYPFHDARTGVTGRVVVTNDPT